MRIPTRRPPRREHIDPDHGGSFRVREFHPTGWPFAWHDHPEAEFTLIESGSGLRYVGDNVQAFGPGDVCLLGPLLPHTWTGAPRSGRPCHSIVAQFPAAVAGTDIPLAELAAVRAAVDRASRGLRLRGTLARDAAGSLRRLAASREPFERLALLWQALARCADAGPRHVEELASPLARPSPTTDRRLAAVLALVDAHATTEIPLARAAQVSGLSATGFCRWFRRRTGRTFVAYRNAVRVGLTRRLLLETDDSITSIAFAAGFGSLANFNRRFLAEVGSTPRAFRARRP